MIDSIDRYGAGLAATLVPADKLGAQCHWLVAGGPPSVPLRQRSASSADVDHRATAWATVSHFEPLCPKNPQRK